MAVAGLAMALFATAALGAQPSPFGVAATLETNDGARLVRFYFTVPPAHMLYPSRLAFETGDGLPLAPVSVPEPVVHRDTVTGREKQVYDHSFAAEFKIGLPAPAKLIVRLQGCSNGASYIPEKRVFNVTANRLVAQMDAPESNHLAGDGWRMLISAAAGPGPDGFKVAGRQTGYMSRISFVTFLDDAKQGRGSAGDALEQFKQVDPLNTLFLIVLALGMALPWLFAAAGQNFLPRPGAWMKYVRYSCASLTLVFAAYYGYLAINTSAQAPLLVRARSSDVSTATQSRSPNELLVAALQQARQEKRPVFIDFAASWCKNSAAMDAAVFPAPEVKQQLKDFVVVKYDAEQPDESPARETLHHFGVMGLPTYVVLLPEK